MDAEIKQHFYDLAWIVLFSFFIWLYYRRHVSSPSERYATFWPRFMSLFVDAGVLWPIAFLSTVILTYQVPQFIAAIILGISSIAQFVYTAIMHSRNGQTVGKMTTRVRVLDFRTEKNISRMQAWLRESIPMVLSLIVLVTQSMNHFVWDMNRQDIGSFNPPRELGTELLLGMIPVLWLALELVTMLTNKKRRALHDFIAGTVVVRTNSGATDSGSRS